MKKDIAVIIFLVLIFFMVLPFFFLHQGVLLIDTGREFYIPQQILSGKILFKDIFNIYGALSYQFNAVLFMIFGQKLNVLAFFGVLNSLLILITLYLISREFLNKGISFLFTLFIMFSLVFQTFLYNSNLTYCFAIVYALSSFLLSLLFLIKHLKNEKPLFAYLACFFAGISIANKYEFILYIIILAYALLNLKIKNALKAFCCFIIMPLISYGILFIQGLNFSDIKINVELISSLVNAPILKQFFLKMSMAVFHNRILGIFAFLPVINIVLLYLLRKEILKNKVVFIFILCAIASSIKSIFGLNVNHMGVFLLPLCSLAFIVMLNLKYKKFIPFLLIAGIFLFAFEDFLSLSNKDYKLETSKGSIYTYHKDGFYIKQVSDFLLNNTNPEDKAVIMPEGLIINFLADRKGDNIYYNLSPLFYFDVFGEEKVLKHFKENLPEYFVILPINNIEYGYKYFGIDYAQKLYDIINDNYSMVQNENNVKIYKKKQV